ncbi:MAG: GIY-YIG nuclease family protein [Patescibacteria group bacterium]
MPKYNPKKIEKIHQLAEAESKPFAVYALYNDSVDKIYIGQTRDLENRLNLHNSHTFKGYTSRFSGQWRIIYTEFLLTRVEAIRREKQLKSFRGREFVKTKI